MLSSSSLAPIDLSRCKLKPKPHQVIGVEAIVRWDDQQVGRIIGGCFFLGDEMGVGKSKQVIDAAQVMFERQLINRVIVVAPTIARSLTWYDPEMSQLNEHLWDDLPSTVTEYHARCRQWKRGPAGDHRLRWVVTNYEFLRNVERLNYLPNIVGKGTLLVGDESSMIKNWSAKQTKAFFKLRMRCGRVVLMNGTPIAHTPMDMFSQGRVMHRDILGLDTQFHFRAKYAEVTTRAGFPKIVGWKNLDDLQRRFKPYMLRRLKKDALGHLPQKLPSVPLAVRLTSETWNAYKDMRDDLVVWLTSGEASVAQQAVVKVLRLSQITSGFIGGVEETDTFEVEAPPDWMPFQRPPQPVPAAERSPVREIGREKVDAFFEWYEQQLEADPNLKLMIWCRFRPEVFRLQREFETRYPLTPVGLIIGGQKKDEREAAVRLLTPRFTPSGPVTVIGTPASGSMAIELVASHTVVYFSNDPSLKTRLQSEDRTHREGQTEDVSYFDLIAEGPQGQKTIDFQILKARKANEDIATWTTAAWVSKLMEE